MGLGLGLEYSQIWAGGVESDFLHLWARVRIWLDASPAPVAFLLWLWEPRLARWDLVFEDELWSFSGGDLTTTAGGWEPPTTTNASLFFPGFLWELVDDYCTCHVLCEMPVAAAPPAPKDCYDSLNWLLLLWWLLWWLWPSKGESMALRGLSNELPLFIMGKLSYCASSC